MCENFNTNLEKFYKIWCKFRLLTQSHSEILSTQKHTRCITSKILIDPNVYSIFCPCLISVSEIPETYSFIENFGFLVFQEIADSGNCKFT